MTTEVRFHRATTVLLTAALLATLTVALTGGQRAEAVDGPVEVVYVATGQNFPDALAGANLAATVGAPMLTVNPDLPIPDATITALQALDPNQIIILGGPVAVSDAVKGALGDYTRSGAVTRIEGGDRHETAARIAEALPDRVQTIVGHATCSGTSFVPLNSGVPYGTTQHIRRFISIDHDFDFLVCEVTPPEGARLTSVTFELEDSSDTSAIHSAALSRTPIDGETPGEALMSRADVTTDAGTPGRVTVTESVSGVVDSSDAYLFRILLGPGTPPDVVAVRGARLTYTIDRIAS